MKTNDAPPPQLPGDVVKQYVDAIEYPKKWLCDGLGISRPALYSLFDGRLRIGIEMAVKFEALFGRSAMDWIHMQNAYDVWRLHQDEAMEPILSKLEALRHEIDVDKKLEKHGLN